MPGLKHQNDNTGPLAIYVHAFCQRNENENVKQSFDKLVAAPRLETF